MDDLGAELFDCLGQRPADRHDVEMVHKLCKNPNALNLVFIYLNYGIRSLERMAALYAKSRKLLHEVCFGIWGCQAKDFYLIPSTDKTLRGSQNLPFRATAGHDRRDHEDMVSPR